MKQVLLLLNDKDPVLTRVSRLKYENETGWQAIIPANYNDAISLYVAKKPDLVVTEILLNDETGRSGYDFITDVRKIAPEVKAQMIILTELRQEADKDKAKALGVTSYFVKSEISLKDFIQELKKIVGA